MNEDLTECQCEKNENQAEQNEPMSWLTLKPIQQRHGA